VNELVPDESPFAGADFARVWDGWHGRHCVDLTVAGFTAPYVLRSVGPLASRSALPFGIPYFVDDTRPECAAWIDRFFSLKPTYRATLTLYRPPRRAYPRVEWIRQERMVIPLHGDWKSGIRTEARRRARRAGEYGWQIADLESNQLPHLESAITDTDRRHGSESYIDVAFLTRLREVMPDPHRLRVLAATRDGEVGAFRVILKAGDYQVSWTLCTTERGRSEHVGPYLTLAWLEESAAAGCRCADLGASPTAGVQEFKASFGAQPAYLFTGIRRWHLRGR
jgi:hypothetical protein